MTKSQKSAFSGRSLRRCLSTSSNRFLGRLWDHIDLAEHIHPHSFEHFLTLFLEITTHMAADCFSHSFSNCVGDDGGDLTIFGDCGHPISHPSSMLGESRAKRRCVRSFAPRAHAHTPDVSSSHGFAGRGTAWATRIRAGAIL